MPIISKIVKIKPITKKQKTPKGSPVSTKKPNTSSPSAMFPALASASEQDLSCKYSQEKIEALAEIQDFSGVGDYLGYVVMLIPVAHAERANLGDVDDYISGLESKIKTQKNQSGHFKSPSAEPSADHPQDEFFCFVGKNDVTDINQETLAEGEVIVPADLADEYVAISLPVFKGVAPAFDDGFGIAHLRQVVFWSYGGLLDRDGEIEVTKQVAKLELSPQRLPQPTAAEPATDSANSTEPLAKGASVVINPTYRFELVGRQCSILLPDSFSEKDVMSSKPVPSGAKKT